ncbi:MAG: DMT family transporter [Acidobacteriales bacterium]|nr:DMT family transporter [Terriglobales bacterium]
MRSWLLLFACNLMWALQFTCIKLVEGQVGGLFTVWAPMTLATVMLYPLIRLEKHRTPLNKKDALTFLMLAGLGIFPGQVIMTWGTRLSLASNAAMLMLTMPVSTALFAVLFLRERMIPVRWVSFAAALVGVVLCSGGDLRNLNFSSGYLVGNFLIFVGTLGSAFYNSYGKRMLERYSAMEMLFYSYVAMFIIVTPLVVWLEPGSFLAVPHFTRQTWTGMGLLTFFHNYLSMVLFLKALQKLDAIQAALCNYLVTAFGLPVAAIWLGERLSPAAITGGVLVLASTLAITIWEEFRKPEQA